MRSEKAAGGTRHRSPTGRGKSEPAAGKDAAPGLNLVDVDPWGVFEKLWEEPNESEPASDSGGEREAGRRMPARKPGSRRRADRREPCIPSIPRSKILRICLSQPRLRASVEY